MTTTSRPKLAIEVGNYLRGNLAAVVDYVQLAERLGVDAVWSAEAWSQDAATILAYLAARTERIALGSGIFQISTRAPSMTAMTAMSLNVLSGGRFRLGLGVSGPQVVEGLHGVAYDKPLTRLRETVEICRLAMRGEKLEYAGRTLTLPRPGGEGKALRLDHEPAEIPIYLATLGPNALRYTGEAADGWLGTSFSPARAGAHFDHIREGARAAGRDLSEIDLEVAVRVDIGEDVEGMIEGRKQAVAFNLGAMGSATTNFYNDAFRRAGYAEDARAVQALWIAGKRREAAARVPDALVTEFAAIGTADMVRARLADYRDAGVTTLKLGLDMARAPAERMALLEQVADMVAGLD